MKILNTKIEIDEREILLGKEKVQVKQYLPSKEKSDLLEAIQEFCFDRMILDRAKLDAVFNGLIIYNYTNVEFEFEEVSELIELYDYFEVNNYMEKVIEVIPEIEYNALTGYFQSTVSDYDKFKTSAVSLLAQATDVLPELMEKISEVSKEIDLEKLNLVTDIYSKTI